MTITDSFSQPSQRFWRVTGWMAVIYCLFGIAASIVMLSIGHPRLGPVDWTILQWHVGLILWLDHSGILFLLAALATTPAIPACFRASVGRNTAPYLRIYCIAILLVAGTSLVCSVYLESLGVLQIDSNTSMQFFRSPPEHAALPLLFSGPLLLLTVAWILRSAGTLWRNPRNPQLWGRLVPVLTLIILPVAYSSYAVLVEVRNDLATRIVRRGLDHASQQAQSRDYAKALRTLDGLQPHIHDRWDRFRVHLQRARLLRQAGRTGEAIEEFDALTAEWPFWFVRLERARCLLQQGSDLKTALQDANTAVSQVEAKKSAVGQHNVRDDILTSYFLRGRIHARLGNHRKAIGDFTEVLSLRRDAKVLFARAKSRFRLDIVDGTLADCNEALAEQPDLLAARALRGKAHLAQEDFREALHDFERVLAKRPNDATIAQLRARTIERLQQKSRANSAP